MFNRSRVEPVEARHHQHVALVELVEGAAQSGAVGPRRQNRGCESAVLTRTRTGARPADKYAHS
jgi:hypothetical protein